MLAFLLYCTQQLKLRKRFAFVLFDLSCGIFTYFIAYYGHYYFIVRLRRALSSAGGLLFYLPYLASSLRFAVLWLLCYDTATLLRRASNALQSQCEFAETVSGQFDLRLALRHNCVRFDFCAWRTDGQKLLGNDGVALLRSTKLSLNQAPSFDEAWIWYLY